MRWETLKERDKFLVLAGLFLTFYFMPAESPALQNAILNGFKMLHEYARQHILTCLVPAFLIAGAINVFIKKEAILKYLGPKARKHVAYAIASVSGSVLAVCSCTILPLFAGITKRGAGLGPATTFLFSGPAINIAAMFLTISVLGWKIGLARIVAAITISILVGITMELLFKEKTEKGGLYIHETKEQETKKSAVTTFLASLVAILVTNGLQTDQTLKYGLTSLFTLAAITTAATQFSKQTTRQWLQETWNLAKQLLPYLFVGVFIAGLLMPLLPQSWIESTVGQNTLTANLLSSVIGALMYFSTLTEIPLLQALIAKGMAPGPALALLLAGPSLSLPNMLVIRQVLGTKKTLAYVTLVIIYSTVAGRVVGML